jgi:hypothetical protein
MNFRLHLKPGPGKYDPPNSLSDNEYQILLEDIDQAVAEGNRKYGYGYSYSYDEDIKSKHIKSKPKPKPRSKLRPQIYYNRVRPKQYHHYHQQPMIKVKGFR